MQFTSPTNTYASRGKAEFLLWECKSTVGEHKFYKNIGASLNFLAPAWWFETSSIRTEEPQLLGTTAQNSVARATWRLKFVYPSSMVLETA